MSMPSETQKGDKSNYLIRGNRCRGNSWTYPLLVLAVVWFVCGCSQKVTRFVIDDCGSGEASSFFEEFHEAYYGTDSFGNVDIVCRRSVQESNPDDEPLVQVLHIRSFWRPHPGVTSAEPSMINALVSYMIVSGNTGTSFDGAGFVSFRQDRKKSTLTGKLESARLTPYRRLGDAPNIFEKPEISGEFIAQKNMRKVVAILNEMKRTLGPMPEIDVIPTDPSIR